MYSIKLLPAFTIALGANVNTGLSILWRKYEISYIIALYILCNRRDAANE